MVFSMKSIRMLLTCATILMFASLRMGAQGGKVTCKDGSASAGGRGACSSHGGILTVSKATVKADAKVARTMEKAADKKEKAEAKMDKAEEHELKGAIAECRDHTYSHAKSRRGVCSSHGGVAKFLTR